MPDLLLRALAAALIPALLAAPLPAGAATIRTVQFEQRQRLEGYDIRSMVTVHPGDEYTPGLVERNRLLLVATGLFREVKADVRESEEGVAVLFSLQPHDLVDSLSVTGNFLVLKKNLLRVVTLKEGGRFLPGKARRDAAAILRVYETEGYSGTTVRTRLEETDKGVQVTFIVAEGKPGMLKNVEFVGSSAFDDETLTGRLRLTLFSFFSYDRLSESVERLEDFYREAGFLDVVVTAEVERGEGVVPPGITMVNPVKAVAAAIPGQQNAVSVVFRIDEGRRYTIILAGHESFTDGDLLPRLTFTETGFFDEHEAEVSRRRLLDFYRQRGYFDAAVESDFDLQGGTVEYRIDEGARYTVTDVVLEGAEHFSRDKLLGRTRTWTRTDSGTRYLRRDYLEEDRKRLRDHYLGEGFVDATVSEAEVSYGEDKTAAQVTYRISEGPRAIVGRISFEGATSVEREKLLDTIKSREGEALRPGWINSDKERILSLVSRQGYPECRVRDKVFFDINRTRADIIYIVDEGEQRRVGTIVVVGSRKTRPGVVLRDFPLKTGDPFSRSALVEGRRNLYGLGYFQQVSTVTPEPAEDGVQDIVIRVHERPTGSVRVGGGYDSEESLRGFVEIGEQNLLGTGRSTSLRVKLSTVERRYDFFYREPWPFGYDINSEANVFEEFRNEQGYDTVRRGVSLGVKREFLERFILNLKYRFELVDFRNVDLSFEDPGKVIREIGDLDRINISSVIATLSYDRRDDPVEPHSGSYHIAGVEVASDVLGGDTAFNKYTFESSWYFPLSARSEAAIGFRGGFAQSLAGFSDLPLSERFFLGGSRGVRGYPEDEVGPMDDAGNPIGGDAYGLGVAEYRFPLGKKRWRGVLFLDVGNVWADVLNPSSPKASAGAGLRYTTPVGPLRLDYGVKLNPDEGETPGRLHFSIGFPF